MDVILFDLVDLESDVGLQSNSKHFANTIKLTDLVVDNYRIKIMGLTLQSL